MDWDDEVRVFLEERASFSPDAMTGMEANLRFAGPETMETRIFGRLTAWQNWIFQRPNAVGENGALKRYGTGAARRIRQAPRVMSAPRNRTGVAPLTLSLSPWERGRPLNGRGGPPSPMGRGLG